MADENKNQEEPKTSASTKATAESSKKPEEIDVSTIGVSRTSFKRIQGYIKNAVDGLEESYHRDKKIVTEKQFKKNAQRIVEQVQNKYDDAWKRNEEQTKEMNEFVEQIIGQAAAKYKEDLSDIKANTVKKVESGIAKNDGSYDYDPEIINDGETNAYSVMPIKKSLIQTMKDGSKKEIITEDKREQMSIYHATNASYSGADMVCTIKFDTYSGYNICTTLGTLQTISYSIYQNKTPVRVLGNMNAKDWVFGPRTIAGSLVFAVFNKHWLIDLYEELYKNADMKGWHFIADEIPPFDITITFANEYGFDSKMVIYGVRLMNEGQTMSTNDIYIENTYQFVANDINLMDTLTAYQKNSSIHAAIGTVKVQTAKLKNREVYNPVVKGASEETSNKVETLEDAIRSLTVTQDMYEQECLKTNLDYKQAKSNLKTDLKNKYKEYKKQFPEKENKKKLEAAYDKAVKTVNEFYNLAKKGKLVINNESSNSPHATLIRDIFKYDNVKLEKYIKDKKSVEAGIEEYNKYIDECMTKVQEKVRSEEWTNGDLVFANKLANDLKGLISSQKDSLQKTYDKQVEQEQKEEEKTNKNKENIKKEFEDFDTKWNKLKQKYITADKTYAEYINFIKNVLSKIQENKKYTDAEKAYAQEIYNSMEKKASDNYKKLKEEESKAAGGK